MKSTEPQICGRITFGYSDDAELPDCVQDYVEGMTRKKDLDKAMDDIRDRLMTFGVDLMLDDFNSLDSVIEECSDDIFEIVLRACGYKRVKKLKEKACPPKERTGRIVAGGAQELYGVDYSGDKAQEGVKKVDTQGAEKSGILFGDNILFDDKRVETQVRLNRAAKAFYDSVLELAQSDVNKVDSSTVKKVDSLS